jgi:uncharacterized protein (TIGR02466 family)
MKIETIFSNFIAYENLSLDNDSIMDFCYKKREENPEGRTLSNVGGWQSNDFYMNQINGGEISKLIEIVNLKFEYIINFLEYRNIGRLVIDNTWININNKENYNDWHNHPKSVIVAVYYAKIPKNSGSIIFKTPLNDYEEFINERWIEKYNMFNSSRYIYNPKVGDLVIFPPWLLHMVENNNTDEERISIAFNGNFI